MKGWDNHYLVLKSACDEKSIRSFDCYFSLDYTLLLTTLWASIVSFVEVVSVHMISCALGHFNVLADLFFPPAFSSSVPSPYFCGIFGKAVGYTHVSSCCFCHLFTNWAQRKNLFFSKIWGFFFFLSFNNFIVLLTKAQENWTTCPWSHSDSLLLSK